MFYFLLLSFVEVIDERASGTDSRGEMFASKPVQGNRSEMLQEFGACGIKFKPPLGQKVERCLQVGFELVEHRFIVKRLREEAFLRCEPMDFGPEFGQLSHFGDEEFAGGEICGGEPVGAFLPIEGDKVVVYLMLQHLRIGDGAGCHDADDIALDEPILIACLPRVFRLLQNGDFMPGFHQFIEVGIERVVRDTCHRR